MVVVFPWCQPELSRWIARLIECQQTRLRSTRNPANADGRQGIEDDDGAAAHKVQQRRVTQLRHGLAPLAMPINFPLMKACFQRWFRPGASAEARLERVNGDRPDIPY